MNWWFPIGLAIGYATGSVVAMWSLRRHYEAQLEWSGDRLLDDLAEDEGE